MKKAFCAIVAVLLVSGVGASAFGQAKGLPASVYADAQIVAESDDFVLYRIPEESGAFRAPVGDELAVEAGKAGSMVDPVWLFNVLTLKNDLIYFQFNTGDEVVHELEFYLFKRARVRFKWAVTGGPEAWTKTSPRILLNKGYYIFTDGGRGEKKTYSQAGNYMFKGSVLAKDVRKSARNTNSSRFFVQD